MVRGDGRLVRGVYSVTAEQKRWLKQLAVDSDESGGASAVLRLILDDPTVRDFARALLKTPGAKETQ